MTNLLSLNELLAGGDEPLKYVELEFASKGGKPGGVYLRPLSAGETLEYASQSEKAKRESIYALIANSVCVDAQGTRMFSTADAIKTFKQAPIRVFNELSQKVLKFNGLGVDDDDETDEAEDSPKND